jgi:signal transduction histidine kinase/GAF domain-containing protein
MIGRQFQRFRVGPALLRVLGERLHVGDSLVLLGPRNIGKRYVLRALQDQLRRRPGACVGRVSFLASGDHDGAGEAVCNRVTRLPDDPRSALQWVTDQFAAREGPVVLIASNIDELPKEQLRELLGRIRPLVCGIGVPEGRRLITVLTGELDLSRVLAPPLSEFDCAHHYILAGFDHDTFLKIARHYFDTMGRFVEDPMPEELEVLYRRTGGNCYYLRLILWSLFDRHVSGHIGGIDDNPPPVRINQDSDEEVAADVRWDARLRYVHGSLETDPDSWAQLEQLVREGSVRAEGNAPHRFELAGVAVREGNLLVSPGSLCSAFLGLYYQDRRFADYHARRGQWDEAFPRYRRLDRALRIRPATADDVVETTDLVKSLRTSLYRKALDRPEDVLALFAGGCRDLLGFHEVTLWRQQGDCWQADTREGSCFDAPAGQGWRYIQILRFLPGVPGLLPLDELTSQSVVAARLPNPHPGTLEVVIVGCPGERTVLSRARGDLIAVLVGDLVDAYRHAQNAAQTRGLVRTQALFSGIVSEIVASLGDQVVNVKQVLERAAERLHTLYQRVIFSLVDPTGARIEAVVERSHDEGKEASRRPSYPLDGSVESGHAWVVREGERLVTDASRDPRCCRELVDDLKIRGIAIVPLTAPGGKVLGVLSVEPAGGVVPNDDEAEVIENFGKQLAAVLLSAKRVAFLSKALDGRPEQVAFFDSSGGQSRLRYANKAAEWALDHHGWIANEDAPTFAELRGDPKRCELADHFEPLIANAFRTGRPQESAAKIRLKSEREFRIESSAIPITDYHAEFHPFQHQTTGVICQTRVVDDVYRMYRVIQEVVSARSSKEVLERVMTAVQELGYTHGRLYLLEDGALVGKRAFPRAGNAVDPFAEPLRLAPRDDPSAWESWYAVDVSKSPVVFRYDPEDADKRRGHTKETVAYIVSRSPKCDGVLRKKPKEYWIDFPLLAGDQVVGKITLDCVAGEAPRHTGACPPEATAPRDFEFLRVLCELTAVLLKAWGGWDRDMKDRLARRTELVRNAMHDFRTRLASVTAAQRHYDIVMGILTDSRDPNALPDEEVRRLIRGNKLLESAKRDLYDYCDETLARCIANEVADELKLERVDVGELLESVARSYSDVRLVCAVPSGGIEAVLDRLRFSWVLRELVGNSIDHGGIPRDALRISLAATSFDRDDEPWLRLTVTDNGNGIKEEDKARIFGDFSTGPSEKKARGLGLFSVKQTVGQHGGDIREAGRHGEGAWFIIELPQYRAQDA